MVARNLSFRIGWVAMLLMLWMNGYHSIDSVYALDHQESIRTKQKTFNSQIVTRAQNNKTKTVHRNTGQLPKVVALTFDDGPDPVTTPKILKLLREKHVKATFFVLGKQVTKHPQIAKQIVSEGHLIANHSWSHLRFSQLNAMEIRNELKRTHQLLTSVTGASNGWFRPPYGEMNAAQRRWIIRQGYQPVMWNVDTRDWAGYSANKICNIVRRQIKPGAIILMHTMEDKGKRRYHTVEAASRIIDAYTKRGYHFLTVDQMPKTLSR